MNQLIWDLVLLNIGKYILSLVKLNCDILKFIPNYSSTLFPSGFFMHWAFSMKQLNEKMKQLNEKMQYVFYGS